MKREIMAWQLVIKRKSKNGGVISENMAAVNAWRERNENEISAAWRQNLKWQWRRHVSGSEISASWLKESLSAAGGKSRRK
jgi:hypothetical protein